MANKTKQTKAEKPKKDFTKLKQSTIGVLELFVVFSIAYSTYVVFMGLEGVERLVMVAPQVLWAVFTLIKRFTR